MNGNVTHGHCTPKKSVIYLTWCRMRGRCLNPKNPKYPNYGGRGISICKEWSLFENFLTDMGVRPDGLNMSLERIDVNGNYCKENCKWATVQEQNNNRTTTKFLEFNGQRMNHQQWAESLGFKYGTAIDHRLKSGWTLERALTTRKS